MPTLASPLTLSLLALQRPFDIHSATPIDEVLHMFKVERVHYSSTWCKGMVALLKKVGAALAWASGCRRDTCRWGYGRE